MNFLKIGILALVLTGISAFGSTAENKRIVEKTIDQVFNQHDLAGPLQELVAEEYIQHNPNVGQGRDGLKKYLTAVFIGFPDWKGSIDQILAEGDKVSVFVTWTGTHRGPFLGVPSTGKILSMRTADIFRVRNGQLVEHWDTIDNVAMKKALGLLKDGNPGAR